MRKEECVARRVCVLVLHELIDRQVTIVADDATVTIVDAAMEQNRNRDWLIQRLAVRAGNGSRIPMRSSVRRTPAASICVCCGGF